MSEWWDERFAWKPKELNIVGSLHTLQLSDEVFGFQLWHEDGEMCADVIGGMKTLHAVRGERPHMSEDEIRAMMTTTKCKSTHLSRDFLFQESFVKGPRKDYVFRIMVSRHIPAIAYKDHYDWTCFIRDGAGRVWRTEVDDEEEAMNLIENAIADKRIYL